MAKKARNELMVGLTVLVGLALGVYIIVMLADWSNMFNKQQEITVRLGCQEGLKGLVVGSPVHLGGIKIGQITRTWIDDDKACGENPSRFRVMFTMKLPAQYQLYSDCVLVPQTNMLGGQPMLAIESLGGQTEPIKPGTVVDLRLADNVMDALKQEFDPTDEASLLGKLKQEFDRDKSDSIMYMLAQTSTNLRDITEKVENQLSDQSEAKGTLMAKMHQVIDNLNTITQRVNVQLDTGNDAAVIVKLAGALDELNASLTKVKGLVTTNEPKVSAMLTSLQNTSATLETDLPVISQKLQANLDLVQTALTNANDALVNLKEITVGVKDTVIVNQDRLDRMIGDLAEVAVNIKLVSREVRRAPWKLLYKPNEKEQQLQKVVDSAGLFAAGAERLNDAAIRLQTILNKTGRSVSDAAKIEQILADLESSFDKFHEAEDQFWRDME